MRQNDASCPFSKKEHPKWTRYVQTLALSPPVSALLVLDIAELHLDRRDPESAQDLARSSVGKARS